VERVARAPELLDLAARSGARGLSIGFESHSEETLLSVGSFVSPPDAAAHRRGCCIAAVWH
jgi:hypothetical protein